MRSIVFSTVSHLDMYTGEDRKDRWRPLLELLRIHDFKVDRLYFFISHLYRHIVPTLVKDMNNVCPETEIVPVITNQRRAHLRGHRPGLQSVQRLL